MEKEESSSRAVHDMTAGLPMRGIVRFALPLIFGYILQQMYLVIDAAIVGRWVGVEALAWTGVCLGDPVAWCMADVFLFPAYWWVLRRLDRQCREQTPVA